ALRAAVGNATDPAVVAASVTAALQAAPERIAACTLEAARLLLGLGPNATCGGERRAVRQLVIMDLPPLDDTPLMRSTLPKPLLPLLADALKAYDVLLAAGVKRLNTALGTCNSTSTVNGSILPDVALFDLGGLTPQLKGVAVLKGMEDSSAPCLVRSNTTAGVGGNSTAEYSSCPDPGKHFYWDEVHPSALVQGILGDYIGGWLTQVLQA
ncbi:hypothetical protein QJQ45_015391, partial [Haematococcus lacustris]